MDNGVAQTDGEPRYALTTHLSARVGRLNPRWNDPEQDTEVGTGGGDTRGGGVGATGRNSSGLTPPSLRPQEGFKRALELVGGEFLDRLDYYHRAWLPARTLVEEAIRRRFEVLPGMVFGGFGGLGGGQNSGAEPWGCEGPPALAVSLPAQPRSPGAWPCSPCTPNPCAPYPCTPYPCAPHPCTPCTPNPCTSSPCAPYPCTPYPCVPCAPYTFALCTSSPCTPYSCVPYPKSLYPCTPHSCTPNPCTLCPCTPCPCTPYPCAPYPCAPCTPFPPTSPPAPQNVLSPTPYTLISPTTPLPVPPTSPLYAFTPPQQHRDPSGGRGGALPSSF